MSVHVEDRAGRPWTEGDLRTAKRTDLSTHEVAQMLGRSYTAVTSLRNRVRQTQTAPAADRSR